MITRWQKLSLRLLLSLCLVCVVCSAIVMMDAATLQQSVKAVPLDFLSIASEAKSTGRALQPLAGSLTDSSDTWKAEESPDLESSATGSGWSKMELPADGRSDRATLTGGAAKRRKIAGETRGREGNSVCRDGWSQASQEACEPAEIVIRAEVRAI